MNEQRLGTAPESTVPCAPQAGEVRPTNRIRSKDLFQRMREIEIEHEGRIYRLRVTQLNKLILTA
ncbi:MAG: hemin uptake protein HemP [Janthinobacterium lividum]